MIPFGGNTFQGPWSARRKRQLGQRKIFSICRNSSATRASRKDDRQGRKERTNEWICIPFTRGNGIGCYATVWERFRREKRVQFPTGSIKMPRRGRYAENAFRRNECLHRNYRLSMLNCPYPPIYLESCKTNLPRTIIDKEGRGEKWSNLPCDAMIDLIERFSRTMGNGRNNDSV